MGRTKGSKNGIRRVVIKNPDSNRTQIQYVPTQLVLKSLKERRISGGGSITKKKSHHRRQKPNEMAEMTVFDPRILKLYRNKRYNECISSIEALIRVTEGRIQEDYRIFLSAAHVMLQNFTTAHDILDSIIATNPQSSFAYFNKGVAYYFDKKVSSSIAMLDMALLINPSAQMNRAREMKMRIDLESRKAVIVLKKMSESDLINTQMLAQQYSEAGEMLRQANRTPQKQTTGRKSLQADQNDRNYPNIPEALPKSFVPSSSEEFFTKAMEQYTTGCLQLALSTFKKSYELNSRSQKTKEMMSKIEQLIAHDEEAVAELEQENYEKVVEIASEALRIDETNHYINRKFFYQKGIALFYLGRSDESLKDYAEFERIDKIIKGEIEM